MEKIKNINQVLEQLKKQKGAYIVAGEDFSAIHGKSEDVLYVLALIIANLKDAVCKSQIDIAIQFGYTIKNARDKENKQNESNNLDELSKTLNKLTELLKNMSK